MTERAPHTTTFSVPVPGVATAGNDDTIIYGKAPYAGTVTGVTYAPDAAITGAATNNRRVALINRGADGTGTTVIAELTFDAGVNAAAGDEVVLTLSATTANRDVAAGDVLAWFSDANGTGIADPGGLATVVLSRS